MKDWKFALYRTLPVMFGYVFMGMAFGILMTELGYNPLWSLASAVLIFAGSGQFLMVELLRSGASLSLVAAMTLLLNSRHLFYGLSFIEKFHSLGRARHYMTFGLTDETYSVFCSLPEEDATASKMVKITFLDHLWWIIGCFSGGLLGSVLPFDTTGIDFSMTALFVVIFIEQWRTAQTHLPAVAAICSSVVFLVLIGPDNFILPSLMVTVAMLLLAHKPISDKMGGAV